MLLYSVKILTCLLWCCTFNYSTKMNLLCMNMYMSPYHAYSCSILMKCNVSATPVMIKFSLYEIATCVYSHIITTLRVHDTQPHPHDSFVLSDLETWYDSFLMGFGSDVVLRIMLFAREVVLIMLAWLTLMCVGLIICLCEFFVIYTSVKYGIT